MLIFWCRSKQLVIDNAYIEHKKWSPGCQSEHDLLSVKTLKIHENTADARNVYTATYVMHSNCIKLHCESESLLVDT